MNRQPESNSDNGFTHSDVSSQCTDLDIEEELLFGSDKCGKIFKIWYFNCQHMNERKKKSWYTRFLLSRHIVSNVFKNLKFGFFIKKLQKKEVSLGNHPSPPFKLNVCGC